jgi:hypothetical protein
MMFAVVGDRSPRRNEAEHLQARGPSDVWAEQDVNGNWTDFSHIWV